MDRQVYHIVGIMSGTSLDGLDMLLCALQYDHKWHYEILKAETTGYPAEWKSLLSSASDLNLIDFLLLHNEYGRYIGRRINHFLTGVSVKPDLVSSHGHTVFHQPEVRFTYQLGSGASIMAETGITTVSDFRTLDVALNGQGAPLVPAGDQLLFNDYDFCLNLGGFANISHDAEKNRIASDLCPVNMVMNRLAERAGLEYDKDGLLAAGGTVIPGLLDELNARDFYQITGPKSLGKEWVEREWMPVMEKYPSSINNLLRTVCEHISIQIARYINRFPKGKVLVTGGGAYHVFLMKLLREKCLSDMIVPDPLLIKFKEALIFALLGVLRYREEMNCFSSVTGAISDSSSGIIWQAEKKMGEI